MLTHLLPYGGGGDRRLGGRVAAAFGPRVRRQVADTPSPELPSGAAPASSSRYDGSWVVGTESDDDGDEAGTGTQETNEEMAGGFIFAPVDDDGCIRAAAAAATTAAAE